MQVIPITTLVYSASPRPATVEERKAKHDKILEDLGAPIHLGSAQKVSHDTKTDRYVATFTPSQGKSLTLRVTNEVAAFVAEHIGDSGYWQGNMTTGILVDVYLIQQS